MSSGAGSVWRDPVAFYDAHAGAFDAARSRELVEAPWLTDLAALLPPGGAVLDLGCGMGDPIAAFLFSRGYRVTGVDASEALLGLARERLPGCEWIAADMRALDLGRRFDGIVVWDSLFHLPPAAQHRLFEAIAVHCGPGCVLLFNSGTDFGESASPNFGEPLYHASLATATYRALLEGLGFSVLRHVVSDPSCGGRTVWLAQRKAEP